VDPAVALESLRGPANFPPGFYGTIRTRLPFFAFVGALSLFLGVIDFNHQRTLELVISGLLLLTLTLMTVFIPWSRMPMWCWVVVPIGYMGVIATVRDAQGSSASGFGVLTLLPVVWIAFYGKRSHLVIGLIALALEFVIPMVVVGGPEYPSSMWRSALVTVVVAVLVTFTFLTMVARDRAYVADLAEQSLFAQRSAVRAMEAREQLDSLLQAATETAIVGADARGVVTFFSTGAERMLGYSSPQVLGRMTIFDFVDPAERAAVHEGIVALVRSAAGPNARSPVEERVWSYRRLDGTLRRAAVAVTTRPLGEHAGLVLVASDVTEREQLAVERERLLAVQREVTQVLVEQNHRLREITQMKDDMVATVSHELRTPLTSIRGFVELLLDEAAARFDGEHVRMLRTIERNSLQLLRVAEDLLTDPGGGHGLRVDFVDTDLATIAGDATEAMHAEAARRRINLTLLRDGPVYVHGDPSRLHQLLDNLLSNATKFTGEGGRVCVRVGTMGQFACLEILDDGPGVPEEERADVFERFYRLASSTNEGIPGTGLGLAIAKAVVEAHDGTVEIVDTPGWSTTFRVMVPLATRSQPEPVAELQF
jgi:PAS domain S-box-containing protein